ncbi:hypothetical protein JMJ56_10190 [Belnapia sp. T18]|uniref:Uncharacterized protein n=1 Tax=Belnapia arida TaxID=2804533 RepID=A0ABS1U1H6_9PROT|nr:hypothetical protein [Belnapia arida]MBL6078375.1 hypothetical protein [Belnapia arida]
MLEQLISVPVSRQHVSFVLPRGCCFSPDGPTMRCIFATFVVAQVRNTDLSAGPQATMLLPAGRGARGGGDGGATSCLSRSGLNVNRAEAMPLPPVTWSQRLP